MLYVTTRNNQDVHTAQRVLRDNRGPDGGLYVPFREPVFSEEEIAALADKGFSKCVAEILNLLFQTRITPWDVDFSVGRYAVRLNKLGSRLVMAETWHNLDSDFSRMVKNLRNLLRGEEEGEVLPGSWVEIGIRIAVLFGIFGELMRLGIASGDKKLDVSVASGDFSGPISVWYARRWGLPIENIVCCCNENGNLWDFICHGQLKTNDVAVGTITSEADVAVPFGLERLIYGCAGVQEVERFLEAVRRGGNYYLDDSLLGQIRQGIYVTVTSQSRILSTIPSLYATHQYLCSPYTALAFAGLQDYRARTGESRCGLILADKSPLLDAGTVASALGITEETLNDHLK